MLTDAKIRTAKATDKPVKLFDGDGLFLLVNPSGSKLWRFKYRFAGKEKLLAMGSYPEISLLDARDRKQAARRQVANGIDPAAERKAEKQKEYCATSFEVVARRWHAYRSQDWSVKHGTVLLSRMENDLFQVIGHTPINAIDTPTLLAILRRVEARSLEIAHRLKIALSQIYRYAIAEGYCTYDPTYALKGALRPQKYTHFASVTNPDAVGHLLDQIDRYHGGVVVRCALRLLPLVFVRPGELRQARWTEFDLGGGLWDIPAERMKMKQPHIVPLSRQAVAILRELEQVSGGMEFVFPTARSGRYISDMAMNVALRSMGIGKEVITGHGFRAMARTMLDEVLGYRADIIEHQLAHRVKDPLGRAYNRTTYLSQRTEMMQGWADYLDSLKQHKSPPAGTRGCGG